MRSGVSLLVGIVACSPHGGGLGTIGSADPPAGTSGDSGVGTSSGGSTEASATTATTSGVDGDTGSNETPGSTSTTASSTTEVPPFCGDGSIDPGETCDDADADELDGCTSVCEPGPLGLLFGDVVETDEGFGGWVEESFDEVSDCGPGEVLVGLRGAFADYGQYYVLGQVQGVCAPAGLANAVPTAIEFGAPYQLPLHGAATPNGSFDLVCPDGSATTRIFGAFGLYLDMLNVGCQPLSLSPGLDAVELGATTNLDPFGMLQDVEGGVTCPDSTVATGFRVTGDAYAAYFHLRCRAIEVELP